MSFQEIPDAIIWRLHLKSPIKKVFQALSTDTGVPLVFSAISVSLWLNNFSSLDL